MRDCSFRIFSFTMSSMFAACVLLGCGGSDKPATYPVRGTVVYRGQPVPGASVTFMGDGAARAATGKTDASGTFQLTTYAANDGAVPGNHLVTVKKYDSDPPPFPTAAADGSVDPATEDKYNAAMARWMATAKLAVPKKYTDPKTSDLQQEVAEGDNSLEIQLVD
jgi:hypothetical protein